MKKKKGFTLVELLAVIVILAVILIIAVPRISEVINNSKKASFEATAKTIASQAEKKYMENEVLGNTGSFECSDVVKINTSDYASCTITFDTNGNATVTLNGSGKFAGLTIKNATKNSATATELTATDSKYFSYDVNASNAKEMDYYDVTVTDQDKCVTYLMKAYDDTSDEGKQVVTTICNGDTFGEGNLGVFVSSGDIPASDYENAGLKVNVLKKYLQIDEEKCTSYLPTIGFSANNCTNEENMLVLLYFVTKSDHDKAGITLSDKPNETVTITGYSVAGGLDVVIPSYIDGYKVTEIANNAFENKGIKSVVIPDTVKTIGNYAFVDNQLTSIAIPSSVTLIDDFAFAYNLIDDITFPKTEITIIGTAFEGNPITEDGTYTYPDNVTIKNGSK